MIAWLRALPLFALVFGVGCFKNTVELETDRGDDESTDDDDTAAPATTSITTVSPTDDTGPSGGPQLLLLAINSPLATGLPLQGIVNLTPGAGTVDLTLQWLSLDLGSTTSPRQPVGDVYSYPALAVDGTGTFYWDTGIILVPGAANPITGTDLVVSIQANVVPVGSPAYCGVAGGMVTSPVAVPLEGSTHAMTAVSDVASLPVDFATACP